MAFTLETGSRAPYFSLPATDGKTLAVILNGKGRISTGCLQMPVIWFNRDKVPNKQNQKKD